MAALMQLCGAGFFSWISVLGLFPMGIAGNSGRCQVVPLRGDGVPVHGDIPQGCRIRDFQIDPKVVGAPEASAWIDAYELKVTKPAKLVVYVTSSVDTLLAIFGSNLPRPSVDDDSLNKSELNPKIEIPVQPGTYRIFVYGKGSTGKYELEARCGDCTVPLPPPPEPTFTCGIVDETIGCNLLPDSPRSLRKGELVQFEFRLRGDKSREETRAGPLVPVPASARFDTYKMNAETLLPGIYTIFVLIDGHRSTSKCTVTVKRKAAPYFDCQIEDDPEQGAKKTIACTLKKEAELDAGKATFELTLRMQPGSPFLPAAPAVELDRSAHEAKYRMPARFPGRYRITLLVNGEQKGGVFELDWPQENRTDVKEEEVRMSRNLVFTFAGFLSGLLTAAEHAERAAGVIAQTVSAATGDVLGKEESLADYVRRAFQLPLRNDTILRYTPDELQKKLPNDRSFQEQFQKEIGRSLERLSLAMAERNADVPLTWDSGKGRWMKPSLDQIPFQKRWVTTRGLEQYGWFPLSYFPGGLPEENRPEAGGPAPLYFDCRIEAGQEQAIDCALKPELEPGEGKAVFEFGVRMQPDSPFLQAAPALEVDRNAPGAKYRIVPRFPGWYRISLLVNGQQKSGVLELEVSSKW